MQDVPLVLCFSEYFRVYSNSGPVSVYTSLRHFSRFVRRTVRLVDQAPVDLTKFRQNFMNKFNETTENLMYIYNSPPPHIQGD